jgi:hypothetical protein
MKYEVLLKQVVMEAALSVGVLMLMGGGVYYLGILADDYDTQTNVLRREALQLQQQTTELQTKFSKVRANADVYQEVLEKQGKGTLSISRQVARDKFNQYNDQYYLGNLRLTMSGIEELSGSQYKRPSGTIQASEVSVNFEAVSDEYVYDMINAMQQQLSGSVKLTRLSLQRQRTLSDDILRLISQKGSFPLVVGEVRFKWLGMKPLDAEENNAIELLK